MIEEIKYYVWEFLSCVWLSVVVLLFLIFCLLFMLPLVLFKAIVMDPMYFALNKPGARMKWIEKKAKHEILENKERKEDGYKWQSEYKTAREIWEKAGRPQGWLGNFDE